MVTPDLMDSTIGLKESVRRESESEFDARKVVDATPGHLMTMTTKNTEVSQDIEKPTLAESVRESVERYISAMDDQEISNLYELVLSEVEAPLLESVLKATHDNQSKTALILGLNRGTLRKKLRKYGML